MTNLLVETAVFAASVLGLALGSRALVDAAVALARRAGISNLVVGLTVVAAGTSAPELVVTVDAALVGLGDVAAGNVVGSNAMNVALVLGVLAAVRAVPIRRAVVRRDGVVLLASTLALAGVLVDGHVSRVEGAVLVAAFVAYTAYLIWDSQRAATSESSGAVSAVQSRVATPAFGARDAALLVGGLAVVLASGHFLVASASVLASAAGLSDALIGATVVAAGTSTPEFAVSLVALSRGSTGVSVGNVVGSNVFNAHVALGVAALVRPLAVTPAVLESTAWLLAVVTAAVALMWTGRQLSRGEGVLFALSELARWAAGLLGLVG